MLNVIDTVRPENDVPVTVGEVVSASVNEIGPEGTSAWPLSDSTGLLDGLWIEKVYAPLAVDAPADRVKLNGN